MSDRRRAPKKKNQTLPLAASRLARRRFSCRLPHCTGGVDIAPSRSDRRRTDASERNKNTQRRCRRAAAFFQQQRKASRRRRRLSPAAAAKKKKKKKARVFNSPHLLTLMLNCLSIRARIWSIVNLLRWRRRKGKRWSRGGKKQGNRG